MAYTPSTSPIAKKLVLKAGHKVLLLRAPEGFSLDPLPEGASVVTQGKGPFDAVLLFVRSKAEADEHAPKALSSVGPGGLVWIAYPKKSSGIKTDITRDVGWEAVWEARWEGVALVSLDDTWSAIRFRPANETPRRSGRAKII